MNDLERALRELRRAAVKEGVLQFLAGVWVGMAIMLIAWIATQGLPS